MKRFFLMSILLAGTGLMGVAQPYSTKEQVEEAARAKVQKHVTELLTSMQANLQGGTTQSKISFDHGMKAATQFLYDENKMSILYGKKIGKDSTQLKSVYNTLIKKNKNNSNPTTFSFSNPVCGNTREIEQGDTKKYALIVPVNFQVLAIADNGASKVKNAVGFEYTVEVSVKLVKQTDELGKNVTDENGKTIKVPSYEIKGMELALPTRVQKIEYLDSEIASMRNSAVRAVVAWYADVQKNIASEYAEQAFAPIASISVSENEIKPERNRTTFEIKEPKEIRIALDPRKYMDEPEFYYENPSAYLTLRPSFRIVVGEDFKTIESFEVTDYNPSEVEKPKTIKEKLEMRDKANQKLDDFAGQLSIYVNTRDSECKDALMNMFEAADNVVEVSHMTKSGKETIKDRKAEDYLKRLKGVGLNVYNVEMIDEVKVNDLNEKYPELGLEFDSNLNHVMYLIGQKYENRVYKDNTLKIVFMHYQENGSYAINRIVVVPENTTLE